MRLRFSLGALALVLVAMLATAAAAAADTTSYAALGDSYTAGDGTGVFYTSGLSYGSHYCYQSPDAYPPLVAGSKGYDLSFAACSGATTKTLIKNQIGSLSGSTNVVTVQIGGNDAGFSTVVGTCVVASNDCSAVVAQAHRFISRSLPGLLNKAYDAIRAAAPNANVTVLGYPRLFTARGTTCGYSAYLGLTSRGELQMNAAANQLDAVIGAEARRHGFSFVDPRAAFSAHEICSSDPWLNNINPLLAPNEWFHPNIAGEATFASLVGPTV